MTVRADEDWLGENQDEGYFAKVDSSETISSFFLTISSADPGAELTAAEHAPVEDEAVPAKLVRHTFRCFCGRLASCGVLPACSTRVRAGCAELRPPARGVLQHQSAQPVAGRDGAEGRDGDGDGRAAAARRAVPLSDTGAATPAAFVRALAHFSDARSLQP